MQILPLRINFQTRKIYHMLQRAGFWEEIIFVVKIKKETLRFIFYNLMIDIPTFHISTD